jgi:hypothetical protein|tara:strand:- start:1123 stop:5367 length:4245 start_codon:yes stop_codon:yes gene_type:complete
VEDELLVNPVDATQAEDTALQEALESASLKQALQQRLAEDQMMVKQLQAAQAEEAANQPPELTPITADQQAGINPPEEPEPEVPMDEQSAGWQSFLEAQEAGPEALDAWYVENYGRTKDEYTQMVAENHDFAGLIEAGKMGGQLALGAGLGLVDTVVDAMALPGVDRGGLGAEFNKWWDKNTRFENPAYQAARNILGALIPVAGLSGAATKVISASKTPRLYKALGIFGADVGIDAAYIGVSDQGKDENLFRVLDDSFPWLSFPEDIKTLDDDDVRTRRVKNLYASGPMAIVGNVLGSAGQLKSAVKKFDWFRPKDETAAAVKKGLQQADSDPETLLKIAEIDEAIASDKLTKTEVRELTKTRQILTEQVETKGYSDVTAEPLEALTGKEIDLDNAELDAAAIRKLEEDPFGNNFDPVITPALGKEGTVSRPGIKPGAVIRNAADNAAIRAGIPGDPAPMISEGMLSKFFKAGGRSRKAVQGLMESFRDGGDFDVKVNNMRFTKANMDEDAFQRYTEIIGNNDVEELRRSFKRDFKNIKGGSIEFLSEEDTLAAGFAMRDLIDTYLGRPVAAQSARVMDTLGAEVRTLAESATAFEGIVDQDIVIEKAIDKLAMLSEEFALSKYVAGWQLQNKNFWNKIFNSQNPETLSKMTIAEFDEASSKAHAQAMQLRKTLTGLKENDPKMMKPLMDAFVLTNGEADTIDKLLKFASDQINPTNYLINKNGMNLFSKNLTSIVLNNVLSGLSAARAAIANTVALAVKPVQAGLGSGIAAMYTRDADELRRFSYIYSGWAETNRRSVVNAWKTLKAVNADPHANIDLIRKDLRLFEDKTWDTIDAVAENSWKKDNIGAYAMYTWANFNKQVAQWPLMRWGTTAMSGADGYVNTTMASQIARVRAYDNVQKAGKELTPANLRAAEKEVYKTMFDENGRLTDFAASHMSGEIALNLDNEFADGISSAIGRIPLLRHYMMFPRTGLNGLQVAGSYVGASLLPIPGFNKYAKVLYARTQDDIAEALSLHGLKSFDKDPNAMAIYKHLKREYMGRLAFSGSLVAALWAYGAAGNVRGNGAINANERKLQRDSLKVGTKEIKIGNNWYSYSGIDSIETVLSIIGDYWYHARDISPEKGSELRERLTWTLAATFGDKTTLTGLEPFFSILDGNENAFNKSAANMIRGYIPGSGALGVLANAVSSSQKDIYNDMMGYVKNRLPFANTTLPEQIDFWTGEPLNDIDNPALRLFQAGNPIRVSDGQEPWRKWLYETGWDGMSMLRTASGGGSYEYTPEQRELIYRYMAEEKLGEKIASDKFMGNEYFNTIIGKVRALKQKGRKPKDKDGNVFDYRVELTPVHSAINSLLDDAKKRAEERLLQENPQIAESIFAQRKINRLMEQGRIDEANAYGDQQNPNNRTEQIQQFSQYR